MTLERDIENAFVAYVEEHENCKALKLRIDGMNGWPDRTVITPRGIFFIEFKASSTARLRVAQSRAFAFLRECNQKVYLAYELKTAKYLFNNFMGIENED